MKFLPDSTITAERIAELRVAVEWAEYELGACLTIANQLGMTWTELGQTMGMTKAGASQFAKRRGAPAGTHYPPAEYERLCRLIGAGDRVERYEVRRITSGRPGVSRVTRETVSTHLRAKVAADRAAKVDRGEVWRIHPSGKAELLAGRTLAAQINAERINRRTPVAAAADHADNGWGAF